MPRSISVPSSARNSAYSAQRGGRSTARAPRIASMTGLIDAPETRTMPMPPRPGAVAIATIGSAAAELTIGASLRSQQWRKMRTMPEDDPLARYGPPLAGVICAVVLSVLVAAMVAGQIGGDVSNARAGLRRIRAVGRARCGRGIRAGAPRRSRTIIDTRVLLWAASIWLWPLFVLLRRRNNGRNNDG